MMNKLSSIKRVYKLWAIAAIQVWVWPQIMIAKLPPGVNVSLFVTMVACIIYNLISIINAYERGEY